MANHHPTSNSKVDLAYRRKKSAEEMKYQIITFALMIALTIVAFVTVTNDEFTVWFKVPFILLLAVIQVLFQLYYFMHMSHKGHGIPAFFLYGGMLVAALTVWAFMTIVWL